MVIIGTVIGAGFASGKEIFTFFNIYGFLGLCGLVISAFIMGFVIYKTLKIIIKYNINSYSELINKVITKSEFMNSVICNIINIFLFISFIVMVAGFSAYFNQELGTPYIIGAIIISTLCFITFLNNINGIVKINKYFIPFLITIILFLGFKNINCYTYTNFHTAYSSYSWFISSILYASYNLIIVIPILINLKEFIDNHSAKFVASLTVFFLLILAITLFFLLNYYFDNIINIELPTVYIASLTDGLFQYVCGFVILGAIFTTAISSGYGFLSNCNISSRKLYKLVAATICIISIVVSNIGFSNLLNRLYPILGILGFIQVLFILFFNVKKV